MLPVGQNPMMLKGVEVTGGMPVAEATNVKPKPPAWAIVRFENIAIPFAPVRAPGLVPLTVPGGHGFAPKESVTVAPEIGAPAPSRAITWTGGIVCSPAVTLLG